MTPPIFTPDGTEVGEVILPDGSVASEVIAPDGTVVFEDPIPDSEDLHARYDAREIDANDADPITSWSDETGNGHDLSGGDPTYVEDAIGGQPVVRFDGEDDLLSSSFSDEAQANHVFILFEIVSLGDDNQAIFDGATGSTHNIFIDESNDKEYNLFAGSRLGDPANTVANEGDRRILSALFDGSDSVLRLDGSDDTTGDVGSETLDGVTLAALGDGADHLNIDVLEVLVYPEGKTDKQDDIEEYLDRDTNILS